MTPRGPPSSPVSILHRGRWLRSGSPARRRCRSRLVGRLLHGGSPRAGRRLRAPGCGRTGRRLWAGLGGPGNRRRSSADPQRRDHPPSNRRGGARSAAGAVDRRRKRGVGRRGQQGGHRGGELRLACLDRADRRGGAVGRPGDHLGGEKRGGEETADDPARPHAETAGVQGDAVRLAHRRDPGSAQVTRVVGAFPGPRTAPWGQSSDRKRSDDRGPSDWLGSGWYAPGVPGATGFTGSSTAPRPPGYSQGRDLQPRLRARLRPLEAPLGALPAAELGEAVLDTAERGDRGEVALQSSGCRPRDPTRRLRRDLDRGRRVYNGQRASRDDLSVGRIASGGLALAMTARHGCGCDRGPTNGCRSRFTSCRLPSYRPQPRGPKTPRLTIRPATSSSIVGTSCRVAYQECPSGVGKSAMGTPAPWRTAANFAIWGP